MSSFYLDNAIAWAQFRVRGGWQSLILILAGYLFLVSLIIAMFYKLAGGTARSQQEMLEEASGVLMLIQIVLLLVMATLGISSSIRRDLTGRQIESHRLMPLAPIAGVLGYVAGVGTRYIGLFAINVAIGAVTYLLRSTPARAWIVANAVLLGFAVTVWCFMAMSAFVSRWIFWIVVVVCGIILFSGGDMLLVAPGLLVLLSPLHGPTIFSTAGVPMDIDKATLTALAAQAVLIVLCVRGAARKYARQEAAALSPGLALAALAVWIGVSFFGINYFRQVVPNGLRYMRFEWQSALAGSIVASLIVAMLVIAAVAESGIARQQQRLSGSRPTRRGLALFLLCFLLCIGMILTLTCSAPRVGGDFISTTVQGRMILTTNPIQTIHPLYAQGMRWLIAAACGIALLQAYFLMRMLYPAGRGANLVIAFVFGLLWIGPLVVDAFYGQIHYPYGSPPMDLFSLGSPVMSIISALKDDPPPGLWTGIAFQSAVLALLAMLFLLQQRRLKSAMDNPDVRSIAP